MAVKIVAIAGSLRKASFNKIILKCAVAAAIAAGAEVEVIDLAEANLPMMNQDLETKNEDGSLSFPAEVEAFRAKILACDGLLIASPEYNFSIPAPLKNAIDWASRPNNVFAGKFVGLCGASPGPLGTVLVHEHLRTVFGILQCTVLAAVARVGACHTKIDFATGELNDEALIVRVQGVAKALVAELALHQ
eukprot:CAMPEP_0114624964 /NCGR_PEP_ID=MMETSP0168-20121206/11031_1 /TAXON_ID=95228 ORGANISM="Vannella sp., Strain DIVA3 517/6/12" /NCGR_SAMPLE_ID=MMETSP0168 /ASSEMBLY_ACC=CAM_ASM_000044 /LENGTH=190 /DNA_ID=CAMNT_0001836241 /DNA_START=12 /DNA_END=584 /DNA_ORIENTATION=-